MNKKEEKNNNNLYTFITFIARFPGLADYILND